MGKPLDHRGIALVMLSICAGSLLAGCFGSKTYPNTLGKNLHVHTVTDSGSWFSRVRAAVDIHRVGEDCTLAYEGTVQLANRFDDRPDEGGSSQKRKDLINASDSFFD